MPAQATSPATTPAPATPAPASPPPAAPPPSAPVPAASPPPAPPAPSVDNPFAEIDAAFTRAGQTPPPAGPAKSGAPPAPPKAGTTPAAPPKGAPPQLRQEYERLKAEHTTAQQRITEYERKIAEAEAAGRGTQVLTERLSQLEKQLQDKDSELRAIRQESSPEFQERYEKPFTKAAQFAASRIAEMAVVDPETNAERPAKWEDFIEVYNLPYGKAWQRAKQLFGEASQGVMNHVEELHRLEHVKREALTEEKAKAEVQHRTFEARRLQAQTQVITAWDKLNGDLVNSIDGYRDPADDKDLAEARAAGIRIIDAETKTPQERLIRNAHVRQRAAAYGPHMITIARQNRKIQELETELDKHRNPTPSPRSAGGSSSAGAPNSNETWDEAARRELT